MKCRDDCTSRSSRIVPVLRTAAGFERPFPSNILGGFADNTDRHGPGTKCSPTAIALQASARAMATESRAAAQIAAIPIRPIHLIGSSLWGWASYLAGPKQPLEHGALYDRSLRSVPSASQSTSAPCYLPKSIGGTDTAFTVPSNEAHSPMNADVLIDDLTAVLCEMIAHPQEGYGLPQDRSLSWRPMGERQRSKRSRPLSCGYRSFASSAVL